MITQARQELTQTVGVLQELLRDDGLLETLCEIVQTCVAALNSGHKILLAGNGGSAADAQHLAGELVCRLNFDRPGLSALALSTDTSVLTAVGDDYGYEKVFSRQINALGRKGDVFLAISTSGRSPNILAALEKCRECGIITVSLTGQDGGRMPQLSDHCFRVPATETQRIQEGHIVVGHAICALIEQAIFGAAT
jgi:D-sedoheptulose 7-phosphate isomerase